eukprot:13563390-Heterocapsa_arctica.AAC.1
MNALQHVVGCLQHLCLRAAGMNALQPLALVSDPFAHFGSYFATTDQRFERKSTAMARGLPDSP